MLGHSKWSKIKRKKGSADAKRGKIFSKLIEMLKIILTITEISVLLREFSRKVTDVIIRELLQFQIRRDGGIGIRARLKNESLYQ